MSLDFDLSELQQYLRKMEATADLDFVKGALRVEAGAIQKEAGEYPRLKARRRTASGIQKWYERGYGPRWSTRSGGVGGTRTSERLRNRWSIKTERNGVRIRNRASYAEFVHGEKQNRVHGQTGWKRIKEVVEDHLPGIQKRIIRMIKKGLT